MKKLNQLLFMLLVVILLNLVGCEMKNNLKSEEQTKVESKTSQVIADTQWSDTMQIHWNHRVYLPKEYEENLDKSILYFMCYMDGVEMLLIQLMKLE